MIKRKKKVKKYISNVILLAIVFILFLAFFEIILRIYPQLLGNDFANLVLSKYNIEEEGIYVYDPLLKMRFMKPNFKTLNYYQGYYWLHETDSKGFRNAQDRNEAEIVLLGDSLIYGHGVNQNQTIGYFLEKFTNKPVVNLARQGDSVYQEMYILNEYGLKFNPKYVFYFFFENDISDAYFMFTEKEIREFLKKPIHDIKFKERTGEYIVNENNNQIYLFKIYYLIKFKSIMKERRRYYDYQLMESSLGWNYTKKAILQMKYVSDLNKVEFVIAPIIVHPSHYPQFNILKEFSAKNNIPFIDTSSINRSDPTLFLPNDGHFSEEGAKAMAKLVSEYIKNKEYNRK